MIDDDFDFDLFEGRVEISNLERGSSVGLDEMTYFRMASCALTAGGLGIEPAMICCLPAGERGAKLILFGKTHQFTLRVRVLRSSVAIDTFAEPLDGLHCWIPLYSGEDNDCHWSRALRSMCEVERIRYVDSHWAAEQGDGDVEAT